jgi:signal peptidase II
MNPLLRLRALGFTLALVVFALDRAIKWYVSGPLQLQYVRVIDLFPFFALRWTENFGISLGLFTATSSEMKLGLLALTGAIALGVAIWMWRERAWGDVAGLALVLGGALGNIVDRSIFGYVVDYADLHFGEWRPFLIFNLADAAITMGVLILLARSLLSREKPSEAAVAPEVPVPENV